MFIFYFIAEGTTTNGDYLLPFKTGAFLARAPVLPVILRYPYQRFSPAWDSISGVILLKQFHTMKAGLFLFILTFGHLRVEMVDASYQIWFGFTLFYRTISDTH